MTKVAQTVIQEKAALQQLIRDRSAPEPYSGCWFWMQCINSSGYGNVSFKNKIWTAHRLSFVAFHGTPNPGMYICHKCDNKACCNPAHLFEGTPTDNLNDCYQKERKPAPVRYNLQRVLEWRRQGRSYRFIADELGVTQSAIGYFLKSR